MSYIYFRIRSESFFFFSFKYAGTRLFKIRVLYDKPTQTFDFVYYLSTRHKLHVEKGKFIGRVHLETVELISRTDTLSLCAYTYIVSYFGTLSIHASSGKGGKTVEARAHFIFIPYTQAQIITWRES